MARMTQIKVHTVCICKQCQAGRWNRISFHLKGIYRAIVGN